MVEKTKKGKAAGKGTGGSTPPAASKKGAPDTRRHVYLDTFNTADFCAKDKNRIADKCKDHTDSEKQKKKADKAKRKKHFLGGLKDRVQDAVEGLDTLSRVGYKKGANNAWMDDHCDGLWLKPWHTSLDAFKHHLGQIKKDMADNIWQVAKDAAGTAKELAKEKAVNWAEKTVAKEAAGAGAALLSGPAAAVVEIGTQVLVAADTLSSVGTAMGEGAGAVAMGIEKYDEIKGQIKKLEEMLDPNLKGTEVWEEAMTAMAAANACMRARKCQLVPYKETEYPASVRNGEGCCPGQTGHHVIPDAAANTCPGYNKDEAPTICLEGTSNTHGSHGSAHKNLKKEMENYNGVGNPPKPISFAEMQKKALDALGPFIAMCSRTCLIAQLKAYYGECKSMVAHPGTPGTPKPPAQTTADRNA